MENIYLSPEANKVSLEGSKNHVVTASELKMVRLDRGVNLEYVGAEFPYRGSLPQDSDRIMASAGILKAVFIGLFSLRPNLVSFLDYFNRIGQKAFGQWLLKDEYKNAFAKELEDITYDFFFSLTSNEGTARGFARFFAHIVDCDSAYRFRFIDIASETSKEKLLKHPGKELNRLVKILADRDNKVVSNKFKMVSKALRFMLWIPKYRKAFKHAIRMSDWNNLVYDNVDRYWACIWLDYKFMGMSNEARGKLLDDNGFSRPTLKEYKV